MHHVRAVSHLEQLRTSTLKVSIASYDIICSLCSEFVSVTKGHGDWKVYGWVTESIPSLEWMNRIAFELERHQLEYVYDARFLDHPEEVVEGR